MTEALSLNWSKAQAASRRSAYQMALAVNLLLQLVIALTCLLAPDFVTAIFALPPPTPSAWIRAWGAMSALVTVLYLSGLENPLRSRYPNIVGLLGRAWTACVWFLIGGGLVWLGLFDLFFAVVLAWLFYRYCAAEIMSRP